MKSLSTQNHTDIWQNELLTVSEVAAYLRVSRVTIWRWCQQGVIPALRVGRNWRVRRAYLLELGEHDPLPEAADIVETACTPAP